MRERPAFELFLISWLVLFLELACIRWFPSHVLFLTFFVNLVLLACFVGMSVGCLVARRERNYIRSTPFWLLAAIALGVTCNLNTGLLQAVFAVGNPAKPDVVYYGTESVILKENPLPFTIPMELVGALFFVVIAGTLVGPGQEMGRAFNRVENRTTAYSANLLGSLVGIGMFAGSSLLRLPPIVWFSLIALVLLATLLRPRAENASPVSRPVSSWLAFASIVALGAVVLLTSITSGFARLGGNQTIWSEYYRIDYEPENRFINTNLISQQLMEPRDDPPFASVPYSLPYLFQRDLKKADGTPAWPEFKRILIIGAGNGNDVARALLWAAPDAQIDAVEIDPVIQKLGELYHPDKPFQDKRVKVFINDGRNFLRQSQPETYDLVVFALIDSLVLQSGYSNLRLESYLYTLESFQDVRRALKPTGVYAVYNFFRQGWIASRIRDQLRTAFGTTPVTLTTPPLPEVKFDLAEADVCTGFFAGREEVVEPLRNAFAPQNGKETKYWYPWYAGVSKNSEAKFGTEPPAKLPPPSKNPWQRYRKTESGERVTDATGAFVLEDIPPRWEGLILTVIEETNGTIRPATDNWPFLYTRQPHIPNLTWRSIVLTLLLSLGLWAAFGGRQTLRAEAGTRPDTAAMLRAFFLGAGFMLVETKAVVEMALLFGGTWMVNTTVFAAILVMSLAGNLFAGRVNPKRLEPYYLALVVSLGVGLVVTPSAFLGLPSAAQLICVCLLVFLPIAFAGVIFATSFKRTNQPDRVFGANVAGALVGGLAENTSVVLGFQLLLCVAIGFYLLSAAFGNRDMLNTTAEDRV
jgi:hypothetical protein